LELVFFFSSRRRHTRFSRDWSSDVCSSDLAGGGLLPSTMGAGLSDPWGVQYGYCVWDPGTASVSNAVPACGGATPRRLQGAPRRSEERRVGKGGVARRPSSH